MNTRKWLAVASIAPSSPPSCSSSKKAGTGSGAGTPATPSPSGLLGDFSGPAAPGKQDHDAIWGWMAARYIAAQKGWTIKFVKADTQTSPAATLTAAKKLLQEHQVSAVLAVSAVTTIAAHFLHNNNVPVIGVAGGRLRVDHRSQHVLHVRIHRRDHRGHHVR